MQSSNRIILQKICREIDLATDFLGKITLEEFLTDEKTKYSIGMASIKYRWTCKKFRFWIQKKIFWNLLERCRKI